MQASFSRSPFLYHRLLYCLIISGGIISGIYAHDTEQESQESQQHDYTQPDTQQDSQRGEQDASYSEHAENRSSHHSSSHNPSRDDYTHIECEIIPIPSSESTNSHPHIPAPRTKRVPAGQTSSNNWSGYAAATNLNSPATHSVSAVSGSWIVPTIKASSTHTYSSMWVGIDGYNSPTVEQIGTEHDYNNGAQHHYAWFEMYPSGSFLISGFPLRPGDVISASVVYTGGTNFVMTIINDTQKVTFTVPSQYTQSSVAQRTSAEWIMEAPFLNQILPLSNFGTAYFIGCAATINGVAAPIGNNSWQNIGIEMVTNTGAPKDLTSALLPDQGSFFVTWQHK